MVQRILRRPEVESCTGLKRSSIYAMMSEGSFPRNVPLGKSAVGWLERDIIAWQNSRIAKRDAPEAA